MKTNSLVRRIFSTLLLALCLVIIPAVQAQTTVFTYQGRLNDGTQAANGIYDLQFALFDAANNQIGAAQTKEDVTVTSGVFSTTLDFGATAFDGAERTLQISVRRGTETGTFTALAPRQAINSAPYAIRALNATNVETTGGNSVVNSINNAATNTTINSSRLAADVVRLNPGATQAAVTTISSNALLDATGTTVDGTNTTLGTSRLRFNFDGGLTAFGQQNFGAVPATGAGSRMMWYPGKFAFRAGKVDNFGANYWDEANVGSGSVAFGENNRATGTNSFAAGLTTTATGNQSVALGNSGTASGERSFAFNGTAAANSAMALGNGAQATGEDSLALGPSSIAGGLASVAIGPSTANGSFGIAIGLQNRAAGNFSVAIGKNAVTCSDYLNCASTAKQGSIVISDGCAGFSSDVVNATVNNQVNIRGCGGFRFFTNQNLTSGVQLASGGGAWSSLSDRNMKENFTPVNSRDVLQRVLKLPISTWNYKSQPTSIRHIGAMAQDFKAAFQVGEDDKMISTIDPDGVAFAAIQGLNEELDERTTRLQKENNRLKEQIAAQNKTLAAFEERLKQLEQSAVKPRRTVKRNK